MYSVWPLVSSTSHHTHGLQRNCADFVGWSLDASTHEVPVMSVSSTHKSHKYTFHPPQSVYRGIVLIRHLLAAGFLRVSPPAPPVGLLLAAGRAAVLLPPPGAGAAVLLPPAAAALRLLTQCVARGTLFLPARARALAVLEKMWLLVAVFVNEMCSFKLCYQCRPRARLGCGWRGYDAHHQLNHHC